MARITRINGQVQPNHYRASLYQEGVSAPVPTVGENSLQANVVWSRANGGLYYLTADAPIFLEGKTYVFMPYVFPTVTYGRSSDTQVYIQDGNSVDDFLLFTPFELVVYP